MSDLLCVKCGKNKRYERDGRVFKLCASCGFENLLKLLNDPDDEAVEHTLAADVCPDCKGEGIVKDGFGQLFECARCNGSGHAAKA